MDLRSAGTPDKEQGGKEAEEEDAAGRPLGRQHCRRVALVLFAEAHVPVSVTLTKSYLSNLLCNHICYTYKQLFRY